MTCFHPLKGFRSKTLNDSGKRAVVFKSSEALNSALPLAVPCGQCRGCRTDRSGQWAIRLMHEAKTHDQSCFLTLTFDDANVPADYSVRLRDVQLFMKKLRKRAKCAVRFFACGEYGDEGGRPHYHLLIFGFDFPDKKLWAVRQGNRNYKSEMLAELWPYGLSEVSDVTFKSAGYVARYCVKKINGGRADDHYTRVSPVDGAVYRVAPEFATMSVKPGIGATWFDKFSDDAFPSDFIVVDGRKKRPPRYYLRKLEQQRPAPTAKPGQILSAPKSAAEKILRERKRRAAAPEVRWNATPERLKVREQVAEARLSRLKRSL